MTASPQDAPSGDPLFVTGGAWTDHRCGRRVPGGRAEHCPVCHESFSTDALGDRHRVGPYDGERTCITRFEMTAKRWRLIERGGAEVWIGPASASGWTGSAASGLRSASQGCVQHQVGTSSHPDDLNQRATGFPEDAA